MAPRLCPGRQFRSQAALIRPGQEARWTFWSQWPLRQQLDFPWRSCAPSNWPATQSGPWLTWTPNESVPGCCGIPTEDQEEVVHTCYSLFYFPPPTVSWPEKKRPGTGAWWTHWEIKENTRDPFNNLFAYDYRKNTEREMLIFLLVFRLFLFTPLFPLLYSFVHLFQLRRNKVHLGRCTFSFFACRRNTRVSDMQWPSRSLSSQ